MPDEVWAPIQAIRLSLKDKGLYRWPPHINLLYPFLPPDAFAEAIPLLSAALARMSGLEITLDALSCFGGRARGVLYAHPSSQEETEALRRLQACLQSAVPFCDEQQKRGVFVPHLTLAHFPSRDDAERAKEALLRDWQPVTFRCDDAVHVMRRDGGGGQFERACTLRFGAVSQPVLFVSNTFSSWCIPASSLPFPPCSPILDGPSCIVPDFSDRSNIHLANTEVVLL